MPYKKSPAKKPLVGKQKNLPKELKEKILKSPALVEDRGNETTTKPNYKGEKGVKGGHRVEIRKADGSKSYATEMNDSIYVKGIPVSKKDIAKAGQTIIKI